jgi:hypothetical protein
MKDSMDSGMDMDIIDSNDSMLSPRLDSEGLSPPRYVPVNIEIGETPVPTAKYDVDSMDMSSSYSFQDSDRMHVGSSADSSIHFASLTVDPGTPGDVQAVRLVTTENASIMKSLPLPIGSAESEEELDFQRRDSVLLPEDCYGTSCEKLELTLDNLYLRHIGCAINERYNVMICLNLKCKITLSKSAFARHVRTNHSKRTITNSVVNKLFNNLNETGIIPVNGKNPGETILKVGGLEVSDGWSCNGCYYFAIMPGSMSSHQRKFHSDNKVDCSSVLIQGQNHTGRMVYFGVHNAADEVKSADQEVWSFVKHDVDSRRGTISGDPLTEDGRFEGQLERSLKWSKEIKGKDCPAIYALACPPNSGTKLFLIRSVCDALLRGINESLHTGDRILRVKLTG